MLISVLAKGLLFELERRCEHFHSSEARVSATQLFQIQKNGDEKKKEKENKKTATMNYSTRVGSAAIDPHSTLRKYTELCTPFIRVDAGNGTEREESLFWCARFCYATAALGRDRIEQTPESEHNTATLSWQHHNFIPYDATALCGA